MSCAWTDTAATRRRSSLPAHVAIARHAERQRRHQTEAIRDPFRSFGWVPPARLLAAHTHAEAAVRAGEHTTHTQRGWRGCALLRQRASETTACPLCSAETSGLGELYKAPDDLIFKGGGFDAAVQAAEQVRRRRAVPPRALPCTRVALAGGRPQRMATPPTP